MVMDSILPYTCEVKDGRLFYQIDGHVNGDDGYHNLYAFDFESGKSSKISEKEARFLKLEGEKVYYIERIWSLDESEKIEFKLMSSNVDGQNAEVVAEFDFLPDESKVFASYISDDTLILTGSFDGEYIYNLKNKTVKYNNDESYQCDVISNGSSTILQKYYCSADGESIEVKLYRYDGTGESELIEVSDEEIYVVKVTENGFYASCYEESDYCGVKFVLFKVK